MPIELTKEETADVIPSLRRYLKEELELEISEMRAKFLLNYFLKDIAPFAYNIPCRARCSHPSLS